MGGSTVITDF